MYLIKYTMIIDGNPKRVYHAGIYVTPFPTKKVVTNIYGEEVVTDWKAARVFFEKEEAEKVMNLFINSNVTGKIYKRSTIREIENRNRKALLKPTK